ncbi:MAG: hypothetical protein JJU02_04675 [Cryomorphaceae bacterium]|nr:hypothetical protein [Cryomorphaceae bacterium]
MPNFLNKFNPILICVLGIFSFAPLHAQQETMEGITNWSKMSAINLLYPIIVTEITTKDGKIFRGTISKFPSKGNDSTYVLKQRGGQIKIIRINNVKEFAWVSGDKRDFNITFDFGLNTLFATRNKLGVSPGFALSVGYEFKSNYVVHFDLNGANFRNFRLKEFTNRSDTYSSELLIGYRFNRTKNHIQTLSFGGGFIEEFDTESNYSPVFSALFDYEFPLGSKSGISLFTRLQFFGKNAEKSHMLLGCKIRLYNRIMTGSL